uniref:Uncharacterized protein n=1 Tax=Anguilla anguilla TaxID=7936 RepID=A0A0E9QN09_ANGAN
MTSACVQKVLAVGLSKLGSSCGDKTRTPTGSFRIRSDTPAPVCRSVMSLAWPKMACSHH